MNKPTVSKVLCVAFCWLSSLPAFAGVEVKVGPTFIEWVSSVDAERWILTVSGPGEFLLRREFAGDQAPSLSLYDQAGDRLPDGEYSWELQGLLNREAGTPELPVPSREKGRIFKQPPEPRLQGSGHFSIVDGGFVAAPPEPGAEPPESPLQNVIAKDSIFTGKLVNTGNGCIGDQCNGLSDADFSALKLRSTLPHLKFDDVALPCEGCPTFDPHDWAVFINQSDINQFAISEYVDDVLTSTPFTLRGGAPDNSLFIDGSGRVGLGTASPVNKLHLFESADTPNVILVESTGTGANAVSNFRAQSNSTVVHFRAHGSGRTISHFGVVLGGWSELVQDIGNGLLIGTLTDKPLILGTNNTNRLHITSTGNVGIGTASPAKKLTVKSDTANDNVVLVQRSSDSSSIFRIFETTEGGGVLSLFDWTGNENVRLTGPGGHSWVVGTMGINCNLPGGFDFSIKSVTAPRTACNTGTFSQINAGSTTFTVSSSRTLKENLMPVRVPDILEKLAAIEVYSYDFIDGPKDRLGLMAEDFHQVFQRGSDKMIDGQEVEMALWLAVKELTEQNKKLADRLASLEAELAAERRDIR